MNFHVRLAVFLCASITAACGTASSQPPPSHNGEEDAGANQDAGTNDAANTEPTLAAIPLTGCMWTETAKATIGDQTFNLWLDTGSGVTAIAQTGCSTCKSDGATTFYTPGPTAADTQKMGGGSYDTGEISWKGEIFHDAVSLGGIGGAINFGAIQTETGFLQTLSCDTPSGITNVTMDGSLGLANDVTAGTDAFSGAALGKNGVADAFAMQLCHFGGTLWLGGHDQTAATSPMQYTPLSTSPYYTVNWTQTAIANNAGTIGTVMIPSKIGAAAVIDSGGPAISLDAASFESMTALIESDSEFSKRFPAKFFKENIDNYSNCIDLDETPATIDAALPTFSVVLGTTGPVTVTLTATESYLSYQYAGPPTNKVSYCQILQTWPGPGPASDLGNHLLIGHIAEFDRANKRFGIATAPHCY